MDIENYGYQIIGEYDVVVCGGGPAGFCAAVQAARMGSTTALVERYGMLGGAMTLGGINGPFSLYSYGNRIVGGIGWELLSRLADMNWAIMPDPEKMKNEPASQIKVNPVMAAHVLDEMCQESGVNLYFHQPVVAVLTGEKTEQKFIKGLVISTKDGLRTITGKIIIDCTGDGDVAAWAGAAYEKGDPETGELQAATLSFYLTGYSAENIDEKHVDEAYLEGVRAGKLRDMDYWGSQFWGGSAILKSQGTNINHIQVDGADSRSRTQAEILGRSSVARLANWIKNDIRDGGNIYPIACSPETWVRESRRILGDVYFTVDDFLSARNFPDSIGNHFYPIDLHKIEKSGGMTVNLENTSLTKGKIPSIPLGALMVRGFKNLLTAGRCISCDRLAQSTLRIQSACMVTGQAAGAAAALSAEYGDIRQVSYKEVQNVLRKHNAII